MKPFDQLRQPRRAISFFAGGVAVFLVGVVLAYYSADADSQGLFVLAVVLVALGVLLALPGFIGIWLNRLQRILGDKR